MRYQRPTDVTMLPQDMGYPLINQGHPTGLHSCTGTNPFNLSQEVPDDAQSSPSLMFAAYWPVDWL